MSKDEQRFDAIRARYTRAVAREQTYRMDVLWPKYRQSRPERSWMTSGEIERLETFRTAQDKVGESMFELLDRIGRRDWRSGVPYTWVMESLTHADATTDDALSVTPALAYGQTDRMMRAFAAPVA